MNRRAANMVRIAGWVAGSLVCCLTLTGCYTAGGPAEASPRSKPRPEIFNQEVVKLTVDYGKETIRVEPDSVRIYLQWDAKRKNRLMPVQVRWIVRELKRDHVVYIVAKEDAPDVEFRFPTRYQERPAFYIDGENNSIASGEVRSVPGLAKDKGYTNRRARYNDGEPFEVIWPYDVVVADGNGKELFRVDPEIVVTGHPPCC